MTVEVVIALALVAAFLFGWIFTHKESTAIAPADDKKVVVDFNARKVAEAKRIDTESPNALLDDLRKPPGA